MHTLESLYKVYYRVVLSDTLECVGIFIWIGRIYDNCIPRYCSKQVWLLRIISEIDKGN